MPDFVIHIGPHKTGTTFLQSTFAAIAPALAEQGVLFPTDQGSPGHVDFVRKLRDPAQYEALAAEIAAYRDSGCRTVLLTSEELAPLRPRMIQALRRMIGPHPVRVVFYCRSVADLTVSSWSERVKHGSTETLDALVARVLATPATSRQVNYGLVLKHWTGQFGVESLRMVSLECLAAEKIDTVAHFAANFLGLETLPARGATGTRNFSLPLVDAELIRIMNGIRFKRTQVKDSLPHKRLVRFGDSVDLSLARDEAARCEATVDFDENEPGIAALHHTLFAQYGSSMVAPHYPDRFFTPRHRAVKFIRGDFLEVPGVREQIEAAYESLALPLKGRQRFKPIAAR